jgi:restriction endonuclease S subunit
MIVKEFARQTVREYTVKPESLYKLLGLRLYGNGLFVRETRKGTSLSSKKLFQVKKGDFIYSRLFAWKGSFSIVTDEFDGCYVSNEFPTFIIDETKVNPNLFLKLIIMDENLEIIEKLCSGSTKVSRNRFKEDRFLDLEFSLPSIETQQFVFNKVNRIADYVNRYSDILSKQIESLALLRKAFLQEAMQGKLVPQDPNDEPASELLKRIKEEKAQLIKEKKLKPGKELQPIKPEEIPYPIPASWTWCRLGDICRLITDGKHGDSIDKKESGYYFLSAKDIQNGKLLYDNARQITYDDFLETHKRTDLEAGDICLVNTGSIGKIAVADTSAKTNRTTFQKSVAVLKIYKDKVSPLFTYWLLTQQIGTLVSKSKGGTIKNLLLCDLRVMTIPLPPLFEQQRIVDKLNNLMKLCDDLKTSIEHSSGLNSRLLNATLREALSPKVISK